MKGDLQDSIQRVAAVVSLGAVLSLAGCGMGGSGSSTNSATSAIAPTVMQGHVHGGQQAVTGATVTIYLAGVNTPGTGTGYGTGASMLASTTTDSNGNFNFPAGTYTCPSPAQQAYIVSSGGNPGLGGTVNNTNAVLMAALGTCPAGGNLITTFPYVAINELTTVAAVWALQQFMGAPSASNAKAPQIGAPNTSYSNGLTGANALSVQSAVIGMDNAFTTAQIMVNIATGTTPNPNYPYAVPEANKIYLLADILAYCINSDPGSSSNCSTLLSAATPAGDTLAADTVQAAWYIAQNPTNNIATLYTYASSSPPYTVGTSGSLGITAPGGTTYKTAFNDATLAMAYAPTLGGSAVLAESYGVAIDAYGNAWFSNSGVALDTNGTTCCSPGGTIAASVSEISAKGSALVAPISSVTLSSTGGAASLFTTLPSSLSVAITSPYNVAIDLNNNAWVGNTTATISSSTNVSGYVAVFSGSTGTNVAGAGTTTGYLTGYKSSAVAIDGGDNVFVVGYNTASSGGPIAGRSLSKMSAIGGANFTYYGDPAAPSTPPDETTNQAVYQIAIDNNPNVSGGIVWLPAPSACSSTLSTTSTDFGLIGQYAGSTVTALADSEIVSNLSGASLGGPSSVPANTSCGTSNDADYFIGQLVSANMANTWGAAADKNNGLWVSDQVATGGFDGLTYLTAPTSSTGLIPSSGTYVNGTAISSSSPTSTAGDFTPYGLEVDGNNNVWAGVYGTTGLVEASVTLGSSGNPPTITPLIPAAAETNQTYGAPFITPEAYQSRFIAIDPSGNVWLTSQSNSNQYANQGTAVTGYSYPNTVSAASAVILVGAAGPVVTPISLRLANNKLGQKP